MNRFKNKVVLITGASRGIGAETARQFAKEGAEVVINYVSDRDSAESVLEQIEGNGIVVQADVSKENEVSKMFEQIKKKYKKLDILVNNAGIVDVRPFKELILEEWNRTFDVNMAGTFLCSKYAIALMPKGSSITNISSIRGLYNQGRPPISDYSASKAAVISFTKTLAKELAPDIRVNTVGPGMTRTDNVAKIPEESIKQFEKDIYLKRLIEPEEVAKAILFFSSPEASAITGALLMVDGGQSLS